MIEFEKFFRYLLPGFAFGLTTFLFLVISGIVDMSILNSGLLSSVISIVTASIFGYFVSQIYWFLHDNGKFGINHSKLFNYLIEKNVIHVTINKKTIEQFDTPDYPSQWVILSQLWYSESKPINSGVASKIDRLSHIIHGTGAVITASLIAQLTGNVIFLCIYFCSNIESSLAYFLVLNILLILMTIILCFNYANAKSKYENLVFNCMILKYKNDSLEPIEPLIFDF